MAFTWDIFGIRARDLATGRFMSAREAWLQPEEDIIRAGVEVVYQSQVLQRSLVTIKDRYGASEEEAARVVSRLLEPKEKEEAPAEFYERALRAEL
jgi:D-serine deaminase-like pyridoxal phosphate-dependent protein